MGERKQATIWILAAIVVSSGFIVLAQRNKVNELEALYEEINKEYIYTQAKFELLQTSFEELDEQASEYRMQLIQLRQDIDKLERYEETWRHYRDFYEEILLENARLNGILMEREYGENITLPMVEPIMHPKRPEGNISRGISASTKACCTAWTAKILIFPIDRLLRRGMAFSFLSSAGDPTRQRNP